MKLSYYPGCSLGGTSKEYGVSVRETAELLGIELNELPDWNCCGASSGHMTDQQLALELSARNLRIAAKTGLDLLAPCSACFSRLKVADKAMREEAAPDEAVPSTEVLHITRLLSQPEWLDLIREKRKRELTGLKLAAYYGCLSLRPPEVTGALDCEQPQGLDIILKELGADPVRWSHKTECCGSSLTMTRSDISKRLVGDIAQAARRGGAEAIVTDCPMCQANLETRQLDIVKGGEPKPLPVLFITELIVAALTDKPELVRYREHLIEPLVMAPLLRT